METIKKSFWFVISSDWMTDNMPEDLKKTFERGWGKWLCCNIQKVTLIFGTHYDEVPVDIHGGLTFARTLTYWLKSEKYSEIIMRSFPHYDIILDGEDWWVFGFDTMHAWDNIVEWPKEAVEHETIRLQQQLEELSVKKLV